jgi:hypothetical protein
MPKENYYSVRIVEIVINIDWEILMRSAYMIYGVRTQLGN